MEILENPEYWYLLGIAVSFLFTVYYFLRGRALDRHGIRVKGTVTDHWTEDHDAGESDDMSTKTIYFLKVYFTDKKGFVHKLKLVVPQKVYNISRRAMAVALIHPPDNPQKAKLDNKSTTYSKAIWWAVILLVLTGCYFAFLYWS